MIAKGFQRGWATDKPGAIAHVWRRAAGGAAALCQSGRVVRYGQANRLPLLQPGGAHRCRRCSISEQGRR